MFKSVLALWEANKLWFENKDWEAGRDDGPLENNEPPVLLPKRDYFGLLYVEDPNIDDVA